LLFGVFFLIAVTELLDLQPLEFTKSARQAAMEREERVQAVYQSQLAERLVLRRVRGLVSKVAYPIPLADMSQAEAAEVAKRQTEDDRKARAALARRQIAQLDALALENAALRSRLDAADSVRPQ
jgi:hypothetical protein